MNSLNLWMWLSEKEHIGKRYKYQLVKDFGSIENVYNADYEDYARFNYLKPEAINKLCEKNCDYDEVINKYKANGVTLITPDMECYPQNLISIGEPPPVLYCRGKFIDLNKVMCISVVGTRKMSVYGSNCAYNFSKDMAKRGAVIVSGMASGIDSKAHRGALDAGMPTVAVIGCGVNVVYPKSNTNLMREIMKTGMVISEYPMDTSPLKHHFPERNKIISALSVATLVVEADIKSGSLITAKHSYEYGKDVFAIPGNINSPFSQGTNYLIKDGAYLVDNIDDIMFAYEMRYGDLINYALTTYKQTKLPEPEKQDIIKTKKQELNKENLLSTEDIILKVMNNDTMSADEIFEISGINISELNSTLLMMELSGKISKLPGNRYFKN